MEKNTSINTSTMNCAGQETGKINKKEDTAMSKNNIFTNAIAQEEATRAQQVAAEEARVAAEAEAARLKAIEEAAEAERKANEELVKDIVPNDIVKTIEDVRAKTVKSMGTTSGVAGNDWIDLMFEYRGHHCLAMGQTNEEVAEDRQAIEIAIARGDVTLPRIMMGLEISGRYVVKEIHIPGAEPCLTHGHTEAERAEDERKARITAAQLNGRMCDVKIAEDAIEAGLNVTGEFTKDGTRCLVNDDKEARVLYTGEKVADITDLGVELPHDAAMKVLERSAVIPEEPEYDEDDLDDAYNDGYDEGHDEGYNEGYDEGYEDGHHDGVRSSLTYIFGDGYDN